MVPGHPNWYGKLNRCCCEGDLNTTFCCLTTMKPESPTFAACSLLSSRTKMQAVDVPCSRNRQKLISFAASSHVRDHMHMPPQHRVLWHAQNIADSQLLVANLDICPCMRFFKNNLRCNWGRRGSLCCCLCCSHEHPGIYTRVNVDLTPSSNPISNACMFTVNRSLCISFVNIAPERRNYKTCKVEITKHAIQL